MSESVALFGGTFNPIHHGHLIVARSVAEHLNLSRVILIPSANPPHKRGHDLADASDRLAMVERAIADEPGFEASDVEIQRSGPSFTILTIEAYREMLGLDVLTVANEGKMYEAPSSQVERIRWLKNVIVLNCGILEGFRFQRSQSRERMKAAYFESMTRNPRGD